MQLPSRNNSRWESIPTQQNPRFPKNVHRAKRDPPKLVRRLSSRRSVTGTAAAVLLQNEFDRIDQLEGRKQQQQQQKQQLKSQRSKRTLLDGLVDSRIRFDKKGHPIIIVRRSTTRTSCSEITVDSGFFSDYEAEEEEQYQTEEDYDDDEEEEAKCYISEERSLVDDDDECDEPLDDDIPRILVLALEPYNASVPVHPSRIVAQEVGKRFGPAARSSIQNFAVDTVAVLTDSQIDDDSRDDRYILAMAAIKKHIQRTQPEAVVVVTEDSLTSHVSVEGYNNNGKNTTDEAAKILEELKSNDIPTNTEAAYGHEICQQWMDRFQRAGLKDSSTKPIVFVHIPPFLPQTASYQYHPRLEPEISVRGIGLAISLIASGLEQRQERTP